MPGQFESILDKLQRKLGKQTIRKASTIARPKPRPEVVEMNLFNEFAKRNPRAGGGLLNGSSEEAAAAAFRKKVEELMDDGYDFGEAVREAMRQGYVYGGFVTIGPNKGKHRFYVEKREPGKKKKTINFYTKNFKEGEAWVKKNQKGREGQIKKAKEVGAERSAKRKEKVENLLKQELETFEKQKVLPKEKLVLKLNEFIKKLGISGPRVSDDLKELQKKYNFKIQPAGAKPDGSLLTADQQKKYKLNYKTKTMAQIAEEISGKTMANKRTKDVYNQLRYLKKKLIKDDVINKKDIFKRSGQTRTTLGYSTKDMGKRRGYDVYEATKARLAEKDPKTFKQDKYLRQTGPKTGEFAPYRLDRELTNFLNLDTMRSGLSTKFPKFLKPSYEHVMGITVGDVIDDPEALRKVDIMTRRYNFKDMGSKSPLYEQVKKYIRTANAEMKLGNTKNANEALKVVNKVYDKVSQRFPSIKRTELPFYKVKDNVIQETNVRSLLKPKTVEKSFMDYFSKVKDSATEAEKEKIKKIQPNVFEVIKSLSKGKVEKAKEIIKRRVPDVKKGALFFEGLKDDYLTAKPAVKNIAGRIPGSAIALAPYDFLMMQAAGAPFLESLGSAGSYFLKDPAIGKAVNVPLALAELQRDPEKAMAKGQERFERGEKFLRKYIPEGIQAALDFDGPQKVKDYFTSEDNEGIVSALKGVK